MDIHVLTLFPEMFIGPLGHSILGRAQAHGILGIHVHDIRSYATNSHRTADDYLYGGGPGMLLKPEPIFLGVKDIKQTVSNTSGEKPPVNMPVLLLSPQGKPLTQDIAGQLSREKVLILICGHYEGIDARVEEHLITGSISIGDYILTGGEIPAMVLIDAIARLLPGALGDSTSAQSDSFASGLLQEPQYTRPAIFEQFAVPDILLSGNHQAIQKWRREQSLMRTRNLRPDLLNNANLSLPEQEFLSSLKDSDLKTRQ
ncbi:tRNA (guanosine(37)-N1)-methyltransferase TrmD [SAR202 cluster bacterium AD-802-E10_MRT_200m]|nr:tRNA (guanosine(37)-N1)-methyltransferase TrmD [SAR202 cluster bacterium AD-802-E10_MRT_200m]